MLPRPHAPSICLQSITHSSCRGLGSVQTPCSSHGGSRPNSNLPRGQPRPACPSSQFFFLSHKSKGISLSSRQGLVGLVFRG